MVKKSVNRMTQLIVDRVERGGDIGVKINPIRYAPNLSDLYALLMGNGPINGAAVRFAADTSPREMEAA